MNKEYTKIQLDKSIFFLALIIYNVCVCMSMCKYIYVPLLIL